MPNSKPIQIENLKQLGVDPKKVNGAYSGLVVCFNNLDMVENKVTNRLGNIKGEVYERLPAHASIEKLAELHKRFLALCKICHASGGLLEILQEYTIDPGNVGDLKLKPEFLAMEKAFRKIGPDGPPDIEVLAKEAVVLLQTGVPRRGLSDKSIERIDRALAFFERDDDLKKLMENIGGTGTLDPSWNAIKKAIETVRTPSTPRISPAGTNPKPGENTPT